MAEKEVTIQKVIGNVFIGTSPEYNIDSVINELLNKIVLLPHNYKTIRRRPSSETIKKISHNNIQSKQYIIQQYTNYSSKVESAFSAIDSTIPFGKHTVLQNLNTLYYAALDKAGIDYFQEIDLNLLKENSEFILDDIIGSLKKTVYESKNTPPYKEVVDMGVNVIVAHAFIECIILENPNDS